jgi:hypothetical protein
MPTTRLLTEAIGSESLPLASVIAGKSGRHRNAWALMAAGESDAW